MAALFRKRTQKQGEKKRRGLFARWRRPVSAYKITETSHPDVNLIIGRLKEVKKTDGDMQKMHTNLKTGEMKQVHEAGSRLTDGKALQHALEDAFMREKVLSARQLERLTDKMWEKGNAEVRNILEGEEFRDAAPESLFYRLRNLCSGQIFNINGAMVKYNEMIERLAKRQ